MNLTDPDGGIRTVVYDLGGRLSAYIDETSAITTLTWDAADRNVARTNPSGGVTGFGYDANDRIITLVDSTPAGVPFQWTTYTYDPVANRIGIADSNGSQTTYTLDAKYRLLSDQTCGTNAHAYTYSYNGRDDVLANSESGSMTTFSHDIAGRITTAISSAGLSTYMYSANGNGLPPFRKTNLTHTSWYFNMASAGVRLQIEECGRCSL